MQRLSHRNHRNAIVTLTGTLARRRVIAVLMGVFALYCIGDAVSFLRAYDKRTPTLKRWLPQAAEIGAVDDFYLRHPDYIYPPAFLVLLKPLTHLPPHAAALIWQFAKYGCLILIFRAVRRLFEWREPRHDWIIIGTILLSARFIHSDLRHGNINIFMAALVIVGGAAALTRRGFTAGFLVAVASCIKVTPAIWAAYLCYRRDWRAVIGLVIGAGLMLEVLPASVLGLDRNHALLTDWRHHVIDPFFASGQVDSNAMNQSIVAVTNRLLGRAGVPPEDRVAMATLSDGAIRALQRTLSLGIIALTAITLLRRHDSGREFVMDWALLAPVSLALSGYTWTGHFCLLIPVFAALLAHLDRSRRAGRMDRLVLSLLVAAAMIMVLGTDLLSPALREWTSRVGAPLVAVLLLFVAMILIRWRVAPGNHDIASATVVALRQEPNDSITRP